MKTSVIFLVILSVFFISCKNDTKTKEPVNQPIKINLYDGDTIRTEVFRIDTGWGYRIYKNDRVFINQTQIPAINGYFLFTSAEKAQKTADFVADKMTKNIGLPRVTIAELDSIGVLDSFMIRYQRELEKQWYQ